MLSLPVRNVCVLVVYLAGCSSTVVSEETEGGAGTTGAAVSDDGTGPPSGPGTSSSPPSTTSSLPSASTTTASTDVTSAGDDSTGAPDLTGGSFLAVPDGAVCGQLPDGTLAHCSWCDPWSQDCAEGDKCVAWSSDGSGTWNSLRCQPLQADPDPIGSPCVAEGSGASGVDSCERGSMCWNVEPDSLEGTCVALCTGNERAPICDDPTTSCVVSNERVLNLCLPSCDPLQQDCAGGHGCYPFDDTFACVREGDPVEDSSHYPQPSCPIGSLAVGDDVVPNCDDNFCCIPYCDLEKPVCPGSQTCEPFFEEGVGFPPPIGYCSGPQ